MTKENSSDHLHINYVKIYYILLVLFAISVSGPLLGVKLITLIAAFGIAVAKALLVAGYFMHLKFERRYIWWLLIVMLLALLLLFIGLAPDVLKDNGVRWSNPDPPGLGPETQTHGGEAH